MKKALILSTILLLSDQNTFTAEAAKAAESAEASPNGAQFESVVSFNTNNGNVFALSPDGAEIVIASSGALEVFKTTTGSMTTLDIPTPNGSHKSFCGVTFPPGRNDLCVATTHRPQVWDLKTKECWVVNTKKELIHCAQLSPDGTQLLTMGRIPPKVSDNPTERLVQLLTDRVVTTAKVWDIRTKKPYCVLSNSARLGLLTPDNPFWSPNGKLVAFPLENNAIGVWESNNPEALYVLSPTELLTATAFSPDEKKIATAEFHGPIKTWCLKTGTHLQEFNGMHIKECCNIFFINDMHFITPSRDGTVRFWDAKTGKNLKTLELVENKIISAAFCPETKILAVGLTNKTVMIFDVETGKPLKIVRCSGLVDKVNFSQNGRTLAVGSGKGDREGMTIQVFSRFNYD